MISKNVLMIALTLSTAPALAASETVQIQDLVVESEIAVTKASFDTALRARGDNGGGGNHPNLMTSGNHPNLYTSSNHPNLMTSGNHPNLMTKGNHPNLYTGRAFFSKDNKFPEPSLEGAHVVEIEDLAVIEESAVSTGDFEVSLAARGDDNQGGGGNRPNWMTSGNRPNWYTSSNRPNWMTAGNRPNWMTAGSRPNWYTGKRFAEAQGTEYPQPVMAISEK